MVRGRAAGWLGASGFRIEANTCIPDGMIDEDAIRYRWDMVGSKLDERGRRMFAAGEVRTAGRGGLAVVSRITGLAREPEHAKRRVFGGF